MPRPTQHRIKLDGVPQVLDAIIYGCLARGEEPLKGEEKRASAAIEKACAEIRRRHMAEKGLSQDERAS